MNGYLVGVASLYASLKKFLLTLPRVGILDPSYYPVTLGKLGSRNLYDTMRQDYYFTHMY